MSTAKAVKSIIFTAQATGEHNSVKIKNVLRWLKSGHEIKVRINGKQDRMKAMESVFNELHKEVSTGSKVIQKVIMPDSIRFILRPTPEAANFNIEDATKAASIDDTMSDITTDKDLLSEDFEEELAKSIKDEKYKNRRK